MNNQLPTVICLLPSVLRIFTTVEDSLQIDPFMQNKPNFQDTQMNVSIFSKMAYEYKHNWTLSENKPNQTQFPSRNASRINRRVFYFDSLCGFGYSIGCFVTSLMVTEP